MMNMTPVTSSNIAAIGYCTDTLQLAVQFKNNKTFVYVEVSPEEHAALMESASVGKHFNQFIKAVKVGREVVTAENDTTDMSDAAMSDKEKIKVLREALQLSTDRLDDMDVGLSTPLKSVVNAKAQADNNRQALEATKDGE